MTKPKAIIVGGKPFNVPRQLHLYFDVVLHIHQDKTRSFTIRPCNIVIVIRDFISHKAMARVVDQLKRIDERIPIVAARVGWAHLYTELVRRNLLPQ